MQFEQLATGFGALEAPRVDARGNLYFSDMIFGGIYKRSPEGVQQHFLGDSFNVGGLVFNQDGRLICSGRGGLFYFDENSGATQPLLTHIEGRAIEVSNDIQVDDQGGIYGGLIDFNALAAGKTPSYGVLYRLDPSGEVTVLATDVGVSNGIGFSPDRTRFYHADSMRGIQVYELNGAHSAPRLLASPPGADGLAVDAEGGIWVACYTSAEVRRYLPNGDLDRTFAFEAQSVLSLCFGGEDLRDLYVVTADFQNPERRAAAVYRARCDVAGQKLPLARF